MTTEQQQPATEVAQQQPKPKTLVTMLREMKPQIEAALPAHITAERFSRIVLTEIRKNPKLAQSTPESFFGSLLTASALGLEPGVNGECYLVPYKNKKLEGEQMECQLILGYQGLAKLFWQHPLAARLSSDYVCERDEFTYDKGLSSYLKHHPADGDRGKVTHYYAIVELSTGARQFDVFTAQQIKVLRSGKEGPSGDIKDPEHWMERKTALRQVLKLMPKATQLPYALLADEKPGSLKMARAIRDEADPVTGEVLPPKEQQA